MMEARKQSFWRGETMASKWAIGVVIPLTLAIIFGAWSIGSETYEGAKAGERAEQQNNECHPKMLRNMDSLNKVVERSEYEKKEFIRNQSMRDTFLIETVKRIERKMDHQEKK
jgi:hypothetical protein